MKGRENTVMLSPCKGVDDTLAQEFMKGEYSGIALFFTLPETRVEELEGLIKIVEEKEKENERPDESK